MELQYHHTALLPQVKPNICSQEIQNKLYIEYEYNDEFLAPQTQIVMPVLRNIDFRNIEDWGCNPGRCVSFQS